MRESVATHVSEWDQGGGVTEKSVLERDGCEGDLAVLADPNEASALERLDDLEIQKPNELYFPSLNKTEKQKPVPLTSAASSVTNDLPRAQENMLAMARKVSIVLVSISFDDPVVLWATSRSTGMDSGRGEDKERRRMRSSPVFSSVSFFWTRRKGGG